MSRLLLLYWEVVVPDPSTASSSASPSPLSSSFTSSSSSSPILPWSHSMANLVEPPGWWGSAGAGWWCPTGATEVIGGEMEVVVGVVSLYVAAAALVYAFLVVFLNPESPRIVEKNPRKFKIDGSELSARRTFIEHTKDEVKSMKDRLNLSKKDRDVTARQVPESATTPNIEDASPLKMPQVVTHGPTRYSRLVNEADSPNSEFIERTLAQQQMMMSQQDDHLDQIASSMGTLKNMSRQIGQEVDEQAVMLDDFGHEMDTTQSKMENTLSKMAKVMHLSSDRRQWAAIGALSGVLAVVVILFFVL